MTPPVPTRRSRWRPSSVRVRLLTGLAVLLAAALLGSSAAGGILLNAYLHHRFVGTLQVTANRVQAVLDNDPQTADDDQIAAFLGAPLGIVAVDSAGRVLASTGSGDLAPAPLATITASAPVGDVVYYDHVPDVDDLAAIRLLSPGLTISGGSGGTISPAAVILCIDTSVDDATITTLIGQQTAIIAAALLLTLGLAFLILRVGMRPLTRMAYTADAIAAGSLTQRLPTRGGRSETDQLAEAVNNAFDTQARAEATIRSFAADASHELRTPLSTISGWLDLHRQGGLDSSALQTALEHVENEVGRMRLLVEELGLLARLDAGRPLEFDAVDLTALVDSVVEDAQVIYPTRVITLIHAPSVYVVGDSARLQQVLRNLVGNAIQHTPGAVTVTMKPSPSTVRFTVTDDGPGISSEDLPRVFDRFWRAEASRSRAHGGSGLGLAIVDSIVHAHLGQVSVESTIEVGTTVTVTLPAHPVEPRPGDCGSNGVPA